MRVPRLATISVAAAMVLACTAPVMAARAPNADPSSGATAVGSLTIEAGTGRVFRTGGTIANLFAADPKVVEVRPASHNSVFVFGLAPGRTTVAAMDDAGNPLATYTIAVTPSSYASGQAGAAARRLVPGADVTFAPTGNGMALTGRSSDPMAAAQTMAIAGDWLGEKQRLDDRSTVSSSVQVTLRVRIAEISRTITRQLGVNWTALANFGRWGVTGVLAGGLSQATNPPNTLGASFADGRSSINTVLDLLAQDQLITILAEPNLTARSGEVASFLAGGEFPIPISQSNNNITIEFKKYGVSLAFVPTVLSDGRISLHVHPEVSELTDVGAVSLPASTGLFGSNTVTVPAITVRRADTTVELGSGQSFAVAGLLSGSSTSNARGLPYLGEIPVLGPLFKSDLFRHDKSELVIVVTPYIVNPASSPADLRLPTDRFVPAGDFDRIVLNRQQARGTGAQEMIPPSLAALGAADRAQVPLAAGFILH